MPDPALLCAGRRRATPYATKRLVQRRNCSDGSALLPEWGGPPRAAATAAAAAAAPSDPLVPNVVASLVILSLAFVGARRLNRFLKGVLM